MDHEIRAGMPAEVRAGDDGPVEVAGYAAIFNERANIANVFEEVIAPGAFAETISRDDVVFLVNHAGLPLARTRSGTLILREDDRGLFIESELDGADPDVQAVVPKMRRGDLDKMSFGFRVEKEEWDDTGEMPLRTIVQASLTDVSVVTRPAYDGTEIGLRSLDAYRVEHKTRPNSDRRKRALLAQLAHRNC